MRPNSNLRLSLWRLHQKSSYLETDLLPKYATLVFRRGLGFWSAFRTIIWTPFLLTLLVSQAYASVSGAKGDGQITSPTVTIASGSKTLTVSSSIFASTDVGKVLILAKAGITPVSGPLETIAVASSGAGYTSTPTCSISDSSGSGSGATCAAILAVKSVALNNGGAGCLNGSQIFLVAMDGTGTPAQVTATVSGGAVTNVGSVSVPGVLTSLGASQANPGYGANCTTAPTFNLSYGVSAIQVTAAGASYSTTATTASLSGGSPTTSATLGSVYVGAPVPPLKTTIASYNSPTSVTLNDAASTAVSGTDEIFWASNDFSAFQSAMSSGSGVSVSPGIYWIGGTLDPGVGSTTIQGSGMNNTILVFDNGTSVSQDNGNWTPLFKNTSGSASSPKGSLEFEDIQIRGLLDFGQVNVGASGVELNNYTAVAFDRVKFYQMPWMAMQNESIDEFSVFDSTFDSVMRDQARCRSCFSARIIGNKFVHSDDDSVAFHQANYLQGPGLEGEGVVVEGNDFEDTTGVHILGAREAVVRGNTFRRTKMWAVNLSWDSVEGIKQLRGMTIADNVADDVITRSPVVAASCVFCVAVEAPSSPAGITSLLPGSAAYPNSRFAMPWSYDLNNVTNGTAFGPEARGLDIHDDTTMRTLPATANYSSWGFGKMLSNVGFIDPVVPDTALKPTAGISASVNVENLNIHHNSIHNVRRGISLNDNVAAPSQTSVSISFNSIYDAWEYGIVGFGSGGLSAFDLIGNQIDVDPYLVSPGRSGGHGGWASNYSLSSCFALSYSPMVRMSDNTFSDCYSLQTANNWVIHRNVVRGSVYSGTTGQPNTWSSANQGVGVFPANIADQFYIEPITADPTGNPPESYGVVAQTHVTSAPSAPTSGFHVVGDVVWSTAPASCSCTGWVILTTGTSWTAGTDYKVQPIQ